MFKGLVGTIISYFLFIILPFLYLLTSIYTLMTNEVKVAANNDSQKGQPVMQIYRV